MNGVEAIREILRAVPESRIIVLTTYDGDEDIHRALKAGAKAYLLKDVFREELIAAVRGVHSGRRHIPARVADRLAERMGAEELTEREVEVLRLIARGCTYREAADRLVVSPRTVETHVSSVLRKLHLGNRHELSRWAADRHLD